MAKITFIGNVGRDAETRHTRDGMPVVSFTVCESKSKPLGNGQFEKLAEQWLNVSWFGEAAQAVAHTITKGTRVEVAGDMWRRDYESQNGGGTSLDVNAVGVRVFPRREGAGQQGGGFGGATPDPRAGTGWGQRSQGAAFDGPNGPTKGADADPWSGGGGGWDTPAATEPGF